MTICKGHYRRECIEVTNCVMMDDALEKKKMIN